MHNLEELLNLVPKYLAGQLTGTELADFEAGLRKHPILRRELEELRELQSALTAADRLDEAHLESDLVARWVFAREDLEQSEKSKVTQHSALCRRCREAIELAQESQRLLSQSDESSLSRWVGRLRVWWEQITLPRLAFSPALTAIVLVVLAIPAFYGVRDLWQDDTGTQVHQVQRLGTRAGEAVERLEIEDSQNLLELSVLLPVQDSANYRFQLLTLEGTAIYRLENLAASEPMVVQIPTTYLKSAEYIIEFTELSAGDSVATIISRFPLEIVRK